MKITIENSGKRYEVVPCGVKCSFKKPGVGCNGKRDYCVDRCGLPKWWSEGALDVYYK